MTEKYTAYGGSPLCNGHKPQPKETSPSGKAAKPPEDNPAYHYAIAVDFDGTLCQNAFPEIGEPYPLVIEYIKRQAAAGARTILHTCRENGTRRALLDEALAFCAAHEIPLYAVNENPESDALFGNMYGTGTARKVYANLCIDDKAMSAAEVERNMAAERDKKGALP